MFSMNLGTLGIHIRAIDGPFRRALLRAEGALKATATKFMAIGQRMTYALSLPLAGMGGLAVKLASDAEEVDSKFRVTFSTILDGARMAMSELDRAYGMNATEAKNLLSSTGDLLSGFGFSQEAALDLSFQVQKLAVDLASFQNLQGGAKRASESLTKALLGERESAKLLGIVIREVDVKARMAENAAKGLTHATENQAKAFATLQIAQEQSKNAIGDYARTSHSFANQWREMISDLKALGEDFGRILLPHAQAFVKWLKDTLQWFKELEPATKRTMLMVAGVTAALGPLLVILGAATMAVGGLIKVFAVLGLKGTLALAAVLGGVALLTDALTGWKTGFTQWVADIKVGGMSIGAHMELVATYIWQAWDWLFHKLNIGWIYWRNVALDALGVIYRTTLRVFQSIERVFWRVTQKIVEGFTWLAQQSFTIQEMMGLISTREAHEQRVALHLMKRDFQQYTTSIEDMWESKILGSLDSAQQRQKEYHQAIAKANEDHTRQMKTWASIRDGIRKGESEAVVKDTKKEIKQVKQALKGGGMTSPMLSGAAGAPGGVGLSTGSFQETSLRRFSLAPPSNPRRQKQPVQDELVAGKIDQLLQLLQSRKAGTAVLG